LRSDFSGVLSFNMHSETLSRNPLRTRDDLQAAMAMLKHKDFGVELKFGNYR